MKVKLLIITIFSCFQLIAQEGIPLYQDYLTSSWYLIHPSTAGAASVNQVRLTARTQWLDVDDAPSLLTASINGRLNKKVGLGILAFSDANGNFTETGIYGTFAYHLNLSARETELNQLSFGISGGILQNQLDETDFGNAVFIDNAVTGTVLSDTFFNVDIGVSYYKQDFYAHLSLKNALPISKNDFILINDTEPDNQRRLIITTGYTFNVGNPNAKISLEPSVQYASTPEINEQLIDVNTKVYKGLENNNTIWGGIAYRTVVEGTEFSFDNVSATDRVIQTENYQTLSGFIGMDYKQLVFAYTYTNQLNDIKISSSGFHQITLGYNFGKNSSARDGSKRWDCNCPAVNH